MDTSYINRKYLEDRDYLDVCRIRCGIRPSRPEQEKRLRNEVTGYTYEELKKSEWSDEFEEGMRNRLILGALRYGKLYTGGKKKYDRVDSIKRRIDMYEKTRNKDWLFDVANEALLEFAEPSLDGTYLGVVDDGEIHTQERKP